MAASSLIPAQVSAVLELYNIIKRLRGTDGCPWDRCQTPQTMALHLMEEAYELMEAIAAESAAEVCEELGDVLFHILFLSDLYDEKGAFDLDSAAKRVIAKMIRRHPHVFGHDQVTDAADVRQRWHQIKTAEKNRRAGGSVLDSVPARMPALMRAYRITERAARSGLAHQDLSSLVDEVEQHWQVLKVIAAPALSGTGHDLTPPAAEPTLVFGRMLLALVSLARLSGFHPEAALAAATREFERRIKQIENPPIETPDMVDVCAEG